MRRVSISIAALVAGAAALLPPMHDLAHDSFAWHMVQHLVLIFVVSPLVAFALPRAPRFPGSRFLFAPAVVVVVQAVVLWAWHLPALYDLALDAPPLHALEHASFVVTATLFWTVVSGRSGHVDHFRRAGAVFVTGLQSAALGALLTFASQPLYDSHLATTGRFGWTALEDQQLAGGIMWIPPGFVYLVITLALILGWMKRSEAKDRRVTVDGGSAT